MKYLLIKDKTQNPLLFIAQNREAIFNKNVFIDNDIFQEIWDMCQANNGTIKLSDESKIKSCFPNGLFCFNFVENGNQNIIKIANIGFIKEKRQLKIISIETQDVNYMHNPMPIARKLFITKNEALLKGEKFLEL